MWDLCMFKNESETWIYYLMILIIFLNNMLPLVIVHLLLPTTLTFSTHMNHVVLILFTMLAIVLHLHNFLFHLVNKWTLISPTFDSNSNFYNPGWSNHSDFLWQAQATGNYALQCHELHQPEYPQFDNQVLHPSPQDYPPQQSLLEDSLRSFMQLTSQSTVQVPQPQLSLEDMLKAFMQTTNQGIQSTNQVVQEIKDATMGNTEAITKLEGQIGVVTNTT